MTSNTLYHGGASLDARCAILYLSKLLRELLLSQVERSLILKLSERTNLRRWLFSRSKHCIKTGRRRWSKQHR